MTLQAGLWIDHREAFVVLLAPDGEVDRHLESAIEKHVRFSGRAAADEGSADDQRDRQFGAHLDRYYDAVIAALGEARSILVFGPGEAKGEFAKRLAHHGRGAQVAAVETADKMTPRQISALVRKHFTT
jgi:NADPH-dependent 2,4-dienoyl-CoA reductase/sulfur reductase-like enzyme